MSKTIAHALRHAPWLYELELDEEGWTALPLLLQSLRSEHLEWKDLSPGDIEEMIAHSPKKRYELNDNRIRALYGHSMEKKIRKIPSEPPEMLYHGTSRKAATVILEKGLLPMGRQYVHLSRDLKTARLVGRRKDEKPVILKVLAGKAHRHGITFYIGYEEVWLADYVPETFITHESEG